MSQTTYVRYPFGKAESQSLSYAAAIAASVNNSKTLLTIAQMTGAATLNLTVNSEMELGAELLIKTSVDGTNRVLTPGTGMTGLAQTLLANKSYLLVYKFDGSNYIHSGTTLLN
jgi:hypothetical protein